MSFNFVGIEGGKAIGDALEVRHLPLLLFLSSDFGFGFWFDGVSRYRRARTVGWLCSIWAQTTLALLELHRCYKVLLFASTCAA
jgi:hypothetical protein